MNFRAVETRLGAMAEVPAKPKRLAGRARAHHCKVRPCYRGTERESEAMASPKAISVELGAQQASLQRHLESGHYGDASEVIRDALRALDQRDAVFDEVLRAQVLASMKNKRPWVPAADVFKRLVRLSESEGPILARD